METHSTYCFPSSFDLPPSFPPQSFAAWKMMDGLDYIRTLDDGNDTLPRKQRPSDLRDAQRRESNTLGDSSTSPPPPVERERCECLRLQFMTSCESSPNGICRGNPVDNARPPGMRNPNGAFCFTQQQPCPRIRDEQRIDPHIRRTKPPRQSPTMGINDDTELI